MKLLMKKTTILFLMVMAMVAFFAPERKAIAAETTEQTEELSAEEMNADTMVKGKKAYAAAITIAVVATAGAIGMAIAIAKSVGAIARQPEAEGKIRTALMLGLVFIETVVIYALIVAILIIFVL